MTEKSSYNFVANSPMSTTSSVTSAYTTRLKKSLAALDKNLTWTVPTVRASDDIQYAEQSNIIIGDDTVSTSEKDETILSLHNSCQEQ